MTITMNTLTAATLGVPVYRTVPTMLPESERTWTQMETFRVAEGALMATSITTIVLEVAL